MTNFVENTGIDQEDENSPRVRNNLRRSLQYGAVVDLLAHGEIHGLVGGLGGVYFNGTPLVDTDANIRSESILYKAYNPSGNFSFTPVISTIWNGRTFSGRNFVIRRALGPYTTTSAASAGSDLLPTTTWDGNSVSTALSSIVGMVNMAGASGIPINVWIYDNSSPAKIIEVVRVEQMPSLKFDQQGAIRLVTGLRVDIPSNSTFYIDAAAKSGSGTVGTSLSAIRGGGSIPLRTFTSSNPAIIQAFHVQSGGRHGDQKSKTFPDSFVDFRKGRRDQVGTVTENSAPSASFIHSPSLGPQGIFNGIPSVTNSSYTDFYDPEAAQIIASSDFTFTQYSATEIDSLDLDIEFPGGLWAVDNSINHYRVFVEFQIIFKYKTAAGGNFKTKLMYGKDYGKDTDADVDYVQNLRVINGSHRWRHDYAPEDRFPNELLRKRASNGIIYGRAQKTPFIERFTLDVTGLQPFTEWAVEVRRLVPGEFTKFWSPNEAYGGACASIIKTVTANIHEKFSYPMSAYAITGFSAQDFPTPPKRAYKIKGKKIRVPTNYYVRDESTNNTASYTRNVTTGQPATSYQTWDGNFRGDESIAEHEINASKVYCNNPAWVFYDILTNKEFGLGEFIEESDIDKYALYQIARYCDELVPDGKGGEEPRFTCNVYLQKEVEAYKVLKDLSSTFRAMMYWVDGQITAVQDRPKEPVYTFTTGNVKDGLFSYTYTGSRARTNQVRVSYNEPLEFYKQTIISVDDVADIAKQGKIIPKDVVAFGCTSESQARRVGKWHLETDTKETEIVTFSTSLNAGFLSPGDIINVQDKRAEDSIVSSGRIISGSTSTSINLDRTVTFPGGKQGKDCNIYIIYPDPGIYLQQETATINSAIYKRGELIQADSTGSNLLAGATSEKAANLKDDSGNPVTVSFSSHSRVEVEAIADSHTGTTASVINTTGAFAGGAPAADAIWAISREEPATSAELKKYRIVGITEVALNEFEITASQYTIEKFDEIDVERPVTTSSFIDVATRGATIPTPSSLIGAMELGKDGTSYDAVISWATPTHTETDSNGTTAEMPYKYLSGFELRHGLGSAQTDITNFASVEGMVGQEAVQLDATRRSFRVTGITPGRYVVSLTTLNDLGHKSRPLVRAIDFSPRGGDVGNRVADIQSCTAIDGSVTHSGGVVTISPSLSLFVKNRVHTITSTGNNNVFNFQNMDENSTAYLLFDASVPSVKIVYLQTDSQSNNNYAYLKESHANKGLTLHKNSGGTTATIAVQNGDTIIGTNSAFTSDFEVGDLIKFSVNVDPEVQHADSEYRIVAPAGEQGVLDSELRVDEIIFDRTDNSSSTDGMLGGSTIYAFKQAFKPDFNSDAIVAKLERGSGSNYTFTPVANPVFANATRNENKGVYSSSTAYSKNDIVTFQGRSYMALVDTTAGQAPSGSDTDNTQWSLLAAKGAGGDPGGVGPSGGDGKSVEVIYKASRHQPGQPGNATVPPSGWSTNVPTAIENIWMSTGRQTVDGDGNPTSTYQWGMPQKLTDVSTNILATLGHLPWTTGTGSQGSDTNTKWDAFGTAAESVREEDLDPFGANTILWKAKDADNSTSADGGFQSPRTAPITDDQTYRFSVFVKTTSDSGLTRFANIGYQTNLSSVETFTSVPSGQTATQSPLFFSGDLPANNKWYLLVGFVNASDSSYSALNVDSGIWSPETGAKVTSTGFHDWKMTGNTEHLGLIAYRHDSAGGETHFMSPRIDIADDRMPSIADLLRTGAAGEGKEFVYARTNYETAIAASRLPSNDWGFDVGGTSDGLQWLDAAPSLSAALPYLWECTRRVVGVPATGAVVEGQWDTPRVIGRYGEDPRTARLEASDYSVVYNTDGASPQYTKVGGKLLLTATAQGYSDPRFKFLVDGNQVQAFGTSNTYEWDEGGANGLPTSIDNTTNSVLKVEVQEALDSTAVSSDSLSIILLKTAAKGDEGDAAHAGVLTNQNHTLPTDADGEYASESLLGNAGGTFEYYIGATKQTSGITYSVQGSASSNGLSININSSTGVYSLSGGSWTGDSATFTLKGEHSGGTTITLSYSIAKAKKGDAGTPAVNKKQVTIFQLVANKGDAPQTPTGGNYTTPITQQMANNGWVADVPNLNSDGDNVYSSTRTFSAADANEGSWSSPTLAFTRRDGVVGAPGIPAASQIIEYNDLDTAITPLGDGHWAFFSEADDADPAGEFGSHPIGNEWHEVLEATQIFIDANDKNGTDRSSYYTQVEAGDILTISRADNVWASFKIVSSGHTTAYYNWVIKAMFNDSSGVASLGLSPGSSGLYAIPLDATFPIDLRFSRAPKGATGPTGLGGIATLKLYKGSNAALDDSDRPSNVGVTFNTDGSIASWSANIDGAGEWKSYLPGMLSAEGLLDVYEIETTVNREGTVSGIANTAWSTPLLIRNRETWNITSATNRPLHTYTGFGWSSSDIDATVTATSSHNRKDTCIVNSTFSVGNWAAVTNGNWTVQKDSETLVGSTGAETQTEGFDVEVESMTTIGSEKRKYVVVTHESMKNYATGSTADTDKVQLEFKCRVQDGS